MVPLKLEQGRKYLAIRWANACRHDLAYAEITALKPDFLRNVGRHCWESVTDCRYCDTQTLILNTIAISTGLAIGLGPDRHIFFHPMEGNCMDVREYLVRAQEAEALANAADEPVQRLTWENIAKEYRRLAKVTAAMRQRAANPSEV
jgi:hypothetical protein